MDRERDDNLDIKKQEDSIKREISISKKEFKDYLLQNSPDDWMYIIHQPVKKNKTIFSKLLDFIFRR